MGLVGIPHPMTCLYSGSLLMLSLRILAIYTCLSLSSPYKSSISGIYVITSLLPIKLVHSNGCLVADSLILQQYIQWQAESRHWRHNMVWSSLPSKKFTLGIFQKHLYHKYSQIFPIKLQVSYIS